MGELLLLLVIGVILWLLNLLQAWVQRQQRGLLVPAVEPRVAIRQRVPRRFGSRRDIRRGIVLMTILGLCRALDPPDPAR
jgi:hypothetical protein